MKTATAMPVPNVLADAGWDIVHTLKIPERPRQLVTTNDLTLSAPSRRYLAAAYAQGIYRHQHEAIRLTLKERNVCLTTGTASGKTLPFVVSAIEHLARNPQAKILAFYPLKALGREQEERWAKALAQAGLDATVGRIDGQVQGKQRERILREAQVVIVTPDIVHAWLLNRLDDRRIKEFLSKVSLLVVDEVHNYTGVFGSNAAFLFRRMQHVMTHLGAKPRYICASATIADAQGHLFKLLGQSFDLVGQELDSSPKHSVTIHMVQPPLQADFLSEVSGLLSQLARQPKKRFITFSDSRKQTEQLATILARLVEKDDVEETDRSSDHLSHLDILPYRSGYEAQDQNVIQQRLSGDTLSGIVSTSALELGLDISGLTTCVLLGVPQSATSLMQRIGRIGRHAPGEVIVINTGSVFDEEVFRHPETLLTRPPAEGALYLENPRIQYIHALCLARMGGEHDKVARGTSDLGSFDSPISWPDRFVELCAAERRGEIPMDLRAMKLEAGEAPNHAFPLRDVESQFRVIMKRGPEEIPLGSLSYAQVMREAYPGAVYYYTTKAYRVYKVHMPSKTIYVRPEKRYLTQPNQIPTLVFPNLLPDEIFEAFQHADLAAVECSMGIKVLLTGFKERRGSVGTSVTYPLRLVDDYQFTLDKFTRTFYTTGIVLTHPALELAGVNVDQIATLLYEAFLLHVPFERRDIDVAVDKYRADRHGFKQGQRFIALYDQTYGSLRLSGKLMEAKVLPHLFEKAFDLANNLEPDQINDSTLQALSQMQRATQDMRLRLPLSSDASLPTSGSGVERVIIPGSKGVRIHDPLQEFQVEAVFFHPSVAGLAYRGRNVSSNSEMIEILPIANLLPAAGESQMGHYNYDTGEITSTA